MARLVDESLTSREALFISPHTVSPLRHTFEKLGVGNRTALAVAAAREARDGE